MTVPVMTMYSHLLAFTIVAGTNIGKVLHICQKYVVNVADYMSTPTSHISLLMHDQLLQMTSKYAK